MWEALLTTSEQFGAPLNVRSDGASGIIWDESLASTRYDYADTVIVQKAAPSRASDPTDGSIVFTDSDGAQAWAGPVSTGNTYTVFARYRLRPGASTLARHSEPEVGSYLVVPLSRGPTITVPTDASSVSHLAHARVLIRSGRFFRLRSEARYLVVLSAQNHIDA